MSQNIPDDFIDLVNGPRVVALSTIMPNGQPQTTVVWCDYAGEQVRVNTMRGFRKEKNMRANPKVTLLCFDPRQPLRYLEIRGTVVEMTESGALEHLDGLSTVDALAGFRTQNKFTQCCTKLKTNVYLVESGIRGESVCVLA